MNDFTNPHERHIVLPEGCKDLLDILQLKKKPIDQPEVASQQNIRPKGFPDIESYMWRMLEPSAERKHLSIHCWAHEEKHLVSFTQPKGVLHLIMLLKSESAQEDTLRSILEREGILPLKDAPIGDLGNEKRFFLFPVPRIAPRAARLVTGILQEVYDLQEDAELEFDYRVQCRSGSE